MASGSLAMSHTCRICVLWMLLLLAEVVICSTTIFAKYHSTINEPAITSGIGLRTSTSELTRLTFLSFGWNDKMGTNPSSISHLTVRDTLLTHVRFTNSTLAGTIPFSISQSTLLDWFDFKGISGVGYNSIFHHPIDYAERVGLRGQSVQLKCSVLHFPTLLAYLEFGKSALSEAVPTNLADLFGLHRL